MTTQDTIPSTKYKLRATEFDAIQWNPPENRHDAIDGIAARERISAFLSQIKKRSIAHGGCSLVGDSFEWYFNSDDVIMIVQTKPGENTAAVVVRPGDWISSRPDLDSVEVDTDHDFHDTFEPVNPRFKTTTGEFSSIPHVVHAAQWRGEKTPDLIELLGTSVMPEESVPLGAWVVRYVEGKFLVLSDEEFRSHYLPSEYRPNPHIELELTLPARAVSVGHHADTKVSLYFAKPDQSAASAMTAQLMAQLLPRDMDPDDVAAVQRAMKLLCRSH